MGKYSPTDLLLSAEMYGALGWSVIPLLADAAPDTPKMPAVPWAAYQSHRSAHHELHHWFIEKGYQGIGIVTGRISGLVVLDFDSPDLFDAFKAEYPDLAKAHVVRTRRGYHVYYQLPPALSVSTRKGNGIDWLAGGCYVVARPTSIAGFAYSAVTGGMPHKLTAHDIGRITHFMDRHTPRSSIRVHEKTTQNLKTLSSIDLEAIYRAQVAQGNGRNLSLFKSSLIARDYGWSEVDVCAALVNLHAAMPAPSTHARETITQRQREATATVQSAFSRPARPPQPLPQMNGQLPTRAREKLHALKLTGLIRVIEGLREKGIQPDQTFNRNQAYVLLRGMVGRDTLDAVLKELAPDGERFFVAKTPSPLPPASKDAADEKCSIETKKCFFGRVTKAGKSVMGRRPHLYTMPSNARLCKQIAVPLSSSDPIQADDLCSAKKTRQAVHRELIKRRPAQYARGWLAKRLGVSVRTVQRYDQELHITVKAMFNEVPLSWANLGYVPEEKVPGTFLQDENQRRYPALRTVAASLLQRGHSLTFKRQSVNFYSLDPPAVVYAQILARKRELQARQQPMRDLIAVEQKRADYLPPITPRPAVQSLSGQPPGKLAPSSYGDAFQERREKAARLTKRRARKALLNAHQEAVVQRVYDLINQRTPQRERRISQATARQCVTLYGVPAVEAALNLICSRRNILKPAGFFMTLLRSGQKCNA